MQRQTADEAIEKFLVMDQIGDLKKSRGQSVGVKMGNL